MPPAPTAILKLFAGCRQEKAFNLKVKLATKSLIPRQVLPVFGQEKIGKPSPIATNPG